MGGFLLLLLLSNAAFSAPFELVVAPVTDQVYAIVGEIGPRRAENHGLNNTLGFVVTRSGVVLIGSGATPAGAQLIEEAVAQVTEQPIQLVVNVGVQDHHWLGNSYFAAKGIPIKALKRTTESQQQQLNHHLGRLQQQVGDEVHTVSPRYATDVVDADRQQFRFGGIRFELLWQGDGHFVGDAVLWLPESETLFTGDFVFHDRMLGVHPTTPVTQWQRTFHKLAELNPKYVIPGHGYPGDWEQAKRESGNYLDWLVHEVKKAQTGWMELEETIEWLSQAPQYSHLLYFDGWHRKNIQQTFIQLESGG